MVTSRSTASLDMPEASTWTSTSGGELGKDVERVRRATTTPTTISAAASGQDHDEAKFEREPNEGSQH